MDEEKKCDCGSPKRRNQNYCDECHENYSRCKTSSERVEYHLQKIKKNYEFT